MVTSLVPYLGGSLVLLVEVVDLELNVVEVFVKGDTVIVLEARVWLTGLLEKFLGSDVEAFLVTSK